MALRGFISVLARHFTQYARIYLPPFFSIINHSLFKEKGHPQPPSNIDSTFGVALSYEIANILLYLVVPFTLGQNLSRFQTNDYGKAYKQGHDAYAE